MKRPVLKAISYDTYDFLGTGSCNGTASNSNSKLCFGNCTFHCYHLKRCGDTTSVVTGKGLF
jgi:hypothetical protein